MLTKAQLESAQVKFDVISAGSLYMAKVEAGADYAHSIMLIDKNSLERSPSASAISAIIGDKALLTKIKREEAYMREIGTDADGLHVLSKSGQFIKPQAETDPEKTIYIQRGKHPLILTINTDEQTAKKGYRFLLSAAFMPFVPVSLVIGVEPQFNAKALLRCAEGKTLVIKTQSNATFKIDRITQIDVE